MSGVEATIEHLWNGESAERGEAVGLRAQLAGHRLRVELEAPFHDDPAPVVPPGRCAWLWEHEVVELFLVGEGRRYLELELGPHGHFLLLELDGVRRVVADDRAVELSVSREAGRWRARAELSTGDLPLPVRRWNAFAIHGQGTARRYLAAHPLGGTSPDFHRLEDYPAWPRG